MIHMLKILNCGKQSVSCFSCQWNRFLFYISKDEQIWNFYHLVFEGTSPVVLSWEHPWACLGPHHLAPHRIGSVRQRGQHKRAENFLCHILARKFDFLVFSRCTRWKTRCSQLKVHVRPGTQLNMHRSTPHRIVKCEDSINDLRHMLRTCSCAART